MGMDIGEAIEEEVESSARASRSEGPALRDQRLKPSHETRRFVASASRSVGYLHGQRRNNILRFWFKGTYQLIFRANWNWRGSSAAVGSPARQAAGFVGSQSGLTSPTLNRLKRLKLSAMISRFQRSPK